MLENSPKISVVLPTYNGEKYLAASIQSVINQTEQNWELIIVNDCSADNTLQIAESFAKNDSRISIINNDVNKKLPASLNIGFAVAKGKYLTWTSDDNIYKPDALEKMSKYLDKNSAVDLVSMNMDFIDEDGNFIDDLNNSIGYLRNIPSLIYGCNIGAAFMYRKTIADRIGKYDEFTFCAEDYDYWCRIALSGKIAYETDNIYQYRINSNSLSATKKKEIKEKSLYIRKKYSSAFFEKFNFGTIDKILFYQNFKIKQVPNKYKFFWISLKIYKTLLNIIVFPLFWNKNLKHKIRKFFNIKGGFSFRAEQKDIKKTILFILGTRPEAIKLAPVILEFLKDTNYRVLVCNTEQQKQLSNQTLNFFGIKANFKLNVMKKNQTLAGVQSRILEKLSNLYRKNKIDGTVVQGDTMSVFCGALVSFYNRIPVFHVEAGLRSYNLFEPFPEEAIRQIVSRITELHFAPTEISRNALLKENIDANKVFITGNTVIDALSCLSEKTLDIAKNNLKKNNILLNDKLVLITAHRRENHGDRLNSILEAVDLLAKKYKDHQFIIPVHPNPNVKNKIYSILANKNNIILTQPLDYPELVCIMQNAKLILTDSGGIQEEAPTFGVPILVMRYETERKEGIGAGFAKLVGADKNKIVDEASFILSNTKEKTRLDGSKNPYGDGHSSAEILKIIAKYYER